MMHEKDYSLFFETLSNKLRMDIILALERADMTVGEISRQLGEEQSKVSHSLEALRACRLVRAEQKGRKRTYQLNRESIMPILKLVDAHVCSNCAAGCKKGMIKAAKIRSRECKTG